MGSAPRFTVALGVYALLLGAVSVAAQESRPAPVYGELPDQRPDRLAAGRRATVARAETAAPKETPRAATPAARPAEPGPSPVAIAAVAETPAAMPPGLSKDAPDTAPSIGVAGGGNAGGRSPAATPEPTTLLLMGAGLAGLYGLRRRR